MKKYNTLIVFLSLFLSVPFLARSQGGQKFSTQGNNLSTNDFLGSTNAQNLVFKVDNIQEMAILTNGSIRVTSLQNGTFGLVAYDTSGILQTLKFTSEDSGYVLSQAGTWVRGSNFSQWLTNGSNIYYSAGNVGIGLSNPTYPLTVQGSALINGTLFANYAAIAHTITIGTFKIVDGPTDSIVSVSSALNLASDSIMASNSLSAGTSLQGGTKGASPITISSGQITSALGNISFANNNLTTTGTVSAGAINTPALNVADSITVPVIYTDRIAPRPGDSAIAIGTHSLHASVAPINNIYGTNGALPAGVAIGGFNNNVLAPNSAAIGNNNNIGTANYGIAIGYANTVNNSPTTGSSIVIGNSLTNSLSKTIMLGQGGVAANKCVFIDPNNMVGVGTIAPDANLNVMAQQYQAQKAFTVGYVPCPTCANPDPDVFTVDWQGNTDITGNLAVHGIDAGRTGVGATFTNDSHYVYIAEGLLSNGDYNFLTQAGDNGIFWDDNNGGYNNSSGFVIAPHYAGSAGQNAGLRIDGQSGDVQISTNYQHGTWTQSHWKTPLILDNGSAIRTATPGGFINKYLGFGMTDDEGAAGWYWMVQTNTDNTDTAVYPMSLTYNTPDMSGGPLLDVVGTIRAHEIKVCPNQTCDFVFDKNYNLMPIDSLSKYLQCNHHLPGIASASEMKAEGDISLGKMDMNLLQKIEELTLYTVQQNKKISKLQKQIDTMQQLQNEVAQLKAEMAQISKNEK